MRKEIKYEISDQKLVRVRFWNSIININSGSRDESKKMAGHVSLQTSEEYVSFWPHEDKMTDIALIRKNSSSGCYARTPEYDYQKYNKAEPQIVDLHELSTSAINKKFKKILDNPKIFYSLIRGSLPYAKITLNCCSLVYFLLKEGSQKPIPYHFSIFDFGCRPKLYLVVTLLSIVLGLGVISYLAKDAYTEEKIVDRDCEFWKNCAKYMRHESRHLPSNEAIRASNREDINSLHQFGITAVASTLGGCSFFGITAKAIITPQNVLDIALQLSKLENQC